MRTEKMRFIGYIAALLIVIASVAVFTMASLNGDAELCGFPVDGDIANQGDCIPTYE